MTHDFDPPPSWASVDSSADKLHLYLPGVYAHHLELGVNNTTAADALLKFFCPSSAVSFPKITVPAGAGGTYVFDIITPYIGSEYSGDAEHYVQITVGGGGGGGSVVLSGSGNSMWSVTKIT
jgi:hypothetical protein